MRDSLGSRDVSVTFHRCAQCGSEHDLAELEPTFKYPDAYLDVPEAERAHRTLVGPSDCRIRDAEDTERRYFLRTLLPVPVRGEDQPCCWGIWVEVSEADFQRAWDLWDDPAQGSEPAFAARLANSIPLYPPTLGLPGRVQLVDEKTRPTFTLATELTHPLAEEQRSGVYPERVFEWLSRQLHA
jgi:hypothetical protein